MATSIPVQSRKSAPGEEGAEEGFLVFITDPDLKLAYCSPGLIRLAGTERIIGSPMSVLEGSLGGGVLEKIQAATKTHERWEFSLGGNAAWVVRLSMQNGWRQVVLERFETDEVLEGVPISA